MKSLEELAETTTSIADLVPKVILAEIEEAARARRFGRSLIRINEDLIRTKGRSIVIGRRGILSASAVSEGASLKAVDVGTLSYTAHTITPTKVGTHAEITQEAIEGCELNLIRDAITEAGIALANKEDTDIVTELLTGTNTINAATEGTWSVSDNAYKIITKAVTEVKSRKWSPKFLVIHPDALKGILQSAMFMDASRYGSAEPILNGEIGKIAGLKVLVTTNMTSTKAVVVDPDRACWMAIRRSVDMKRWDNPDTDSIELYFYVEYALDVTDDDALEVITDIS
jgi:N4-gp56 family major capsid protein